MTTKAEINQRRADFVAGATYQWRTNGGQDDAYREAEARFPYARRPREVRCPDGRRYRLIDGRIQVNYGGDWCDSNTYARTEDITLLASLLEQPDEEVE